MKKHSGGGHKDHHGFHEKNKQHGTSKSMTHMGYTEGNMTPHVQDLQFPMDTFSEATSNSTTLNYMGRRDEIQGKMASKIRSQHYKGRYD
jgi:hypothetical protein